VEGTEKHPMSIMSGEKVTNQVEIDDWDNRDMEA